MRSLPIRYEHKFDGDPPRVHSLQKATEAEYFVVGMGGDDDDATGLYRVQGRKVPQLTRVGPFTLGATEAVLIDD
jgi:hypothetical protein